MNRQNNGGTYGAGPSYTSRGQSRAGSSSQLNCAGPTYGGGHNTANRARAPPVFANSSSGNFCAPPRTGYRQQQPFRGCTTSRPALAQTIGRSGSTQQNQYKARSNTSNYQVPSKPMQQQLQARAPQNQNPPMAGPQYCTPQAIKVNITADQLQNAKNTPIYKGQGDGAGEEGGNGNMKYIQLNWQDLLGGMDNLRVCMAPSADANNPNRQLKVSFGGQKTDPPQAGETPLKVVAIQPALTSERLDLAKGNAFAGTMKVCNPATNMRMAPAQYSGGNPNQGQYSGAYRPCRR